MVEFMRLHSSCVLKKIFNGIMVGGIGSFCLLPGVAVANTAVKNSPECVQSVVGFDVGSGAIKVKGGGVDLCEKKITNLFFEENKSIKFRKDLINSTNNHFSNEIQEKATRYLLSVKDKIEQRFQSHGAAEGHDEVKFCAVATEAFRQADNGSEFISNLEKNLHMPVKIITQDEEGKLAYFAAMAKTAKKNIVVWDVGGGSLQITFRDRKHNNDVSVLGSKLASQTFTAMVLGKVKHVPEREVTTASPYPMSQNEINDSIALAKASLEFSKTDEYELERKIAGHSQVIGVGPLHKYAILEFLNSLSGEKKDAFTKAELLAGIQFLADKTEDEIKQLNVNKDFVRLQLPNMMLVYSVMDKYDIDEVTTLNIDNSDGLLLSGCS